MNIQISSRNERFNRRLLNRLLCVPSVPMCQHFIFTCQRAKDVPFFKLAYQRTKRRANFSTVFKRKNFLLWLTFTNFKNVQAILENLSRETKNLNFDICLFLLTCYKSCFSYLSCTSQILLKKHASYKMITKLLQEQQYSKTQSHHKKRKETRSQ